jgi:hypothetical protein
MSARFPARLCGAAPSRQDAPRSKRRAEGEGCRLGKVRRASAPPAKRNRVLVQSRRPGKHLRLFAKVSVLVGR